MISSTRSAIAYVQRESSFEDRRLLLGHKAAHVTTHYSAADTGELIEAANRLCEVESRKSPAPRDRASPSGGYN